MAARWAHNPEVPGSSPGPATIKKSLLFSRDFLIVLNFFYNPARQSRSAAHA